MHVQPSGPPEVGWLVMLPAMGDWLHQACISLSAMQLTGTTVAQGLPPHTLIKDLEKLTVLTVCLVNAPPTLIS